MEFIDNRLPDRVRILKESGDPECIYQLLQKHFGLPLEILKSKYQIKIQSYRFRIFISGSEGDIYNLFMYLNNLGISHESVNITELRYEMTEFLQKLI